MNSSNRTTILVHYYRAMVGRADVWRMRMDTTTNWAIGATAAIISFALGNPSAPHYVVAIATLMTWSFLLLEARRLSFYHLFQQRALILEDLLLRPALAAHGNDESSSPHGSTRVNQAGDEGTAELAKALDAHLGRTVPTMPMIKAVARRLRRVYLYLFVVQFLAWMLKLANHPEPASSLRSIVDRADAGVLSGVTVMALVGVLAALAVALSFTRGGVDRDPP